MEKTRGRADGEEFSGFISGDFGLYGSYTDLITRQRGKGASGRRKIFINPMSYDEVEGDHLLIAYSTVV